MRRLSLGLLPFFPQAWRARYELEMRALLAEQDVRPRAVIDLVRAAADAHLRPQGLSPAPSERMRNTVGAALCGWIALVICGSGFAKLTEDRPFSAAGTAHPLLAGTRLAIAVLAVLSVVTVVLGGARLIAAVVREAFTERRWPLVRAACAPFVAVAVVAATTGGLAWLTGPGHLRAHSAGAWIAFLAWFAIALGAASMCGLASRAALRLARPRTDALRAGVLGAAGLTVLLALVTAATAVYAVALALDAPALASEANGPFGLLSTTAGLCLLVALMTIVTGLMAITSARGLRALRAAD